MEPLKIMIEGSGRHVHLSRQDVDILFGQGFELEVKKPLSQPGQYATPHKVDVTGPKGTLKGVTVLGPCRKESQVEVSLTDARALGVTPQIRESGVLDGTDGCVLTGPAGQVTLEKGLIAAKRHIHMTPETAEQYGIAWLPTDFKKKGGYQRSIVLSREYDLYRQNFCGCVYSRLEAERREKEMASS